MNLTPEEQKQAIREGWSLYNGGTQFRARLNGPFRTTTDAYEWFINEAEQGSEFHKTVLQNLPTSLADQIYYSRFQVVRDKITANKVRERLLWPQ